MGSLSDGTEIIGNGDLKRQLPAIDAYKYRFGGHGLAYGSGCIVA